MWKDFDRLHTVTEMATNPTVRVMTGGSRMTHQRKEKIEPEDMEWMIKKYGKSLCVTRTIPPQHDFQGCVLEGSEELRVCDLLQRNEW